VNWFEISWVPSISEFWINIDDEPTIIFSRKVALLEEAYGSAPGESRSDKKKKERDKSTTITVSNVRPTDIISTNA